jgi:hypothetical protein
MVAASIKHQSWTFLAYKSSGTLVRSHAIEHCLVSQRSNMASRLKSPVSEMADFSLPLKLQSYMGLELPHEFT